CVDGGFVVDARTGAVLRRFAYPGMPELVNHNPLVLFSPDGESFVTFSAWDEAVVWETATGRPRYPPLRHQGKVEDVAFAPSGRYLVTASEDGIAQVWDVVSGQPAAAPLHTPEWVMGVCFSPDGRQLLTASADNTARLWDWRAGRLACPPLQH